MTPPTDKKVETVRATITVEEACARLGISRSLGYAAAADGTLPTVRVGRRVLVPVRPFEQMLNGETG